MKLQVELEQETALRKKVEEECDNERRKRKKAEQLTLELQEKDHDAKVQQLQENVRVESETVNISHSPHVAQGEGPKMRKMDFDVCRYDIYSDKKISNL